MKQNLWIIIVIVTAFLGFMMGYSMPPFLSTGIAGGKGKTVEAGPKMDKEMQDYYKNLYKDE